MKELSKEVKEIVAIALNKKRVGKVSPEQVTFKDFVQVAKDYLKKHEYLPERWEEELKGNMDLLIS